jgi:TRAP-type C4-dicarboxylate transport system permease small subunit
LAAQPAYAAGPSDQAFQVSADPLPNPAADNNKIQAILAVVFGVLGALSLLMLTVGGFRYVASEGDPQAATRAKGTIFYSILGLVVSISAVAIVTFVIGRI